MSDTPLIISLHDESGNMVRPWAEAGFRCVCVDIAHSIRRIRREGNIEYVWGDSRSWFPDERPGILFSFPPCTHLAGSGARDWRAKRWPLLRDGMDLVHASWMAAKWAGCPYMIENPVGRVPGIHAEYEHTFNPCDYGDPWTKRTCLWTGNGFVMPEPDPVEPVRGSRMHLLPPSDDRQRIRSETPMGFARAVFEANHELIGACRV